MCWQNQWLCLFFNNFYSTSSNSNNRRIGSFLKRTMGRFVRRNSIRQIHFSHRPQRRIIGLRRRSTRRILVRIFIHLLLIVPRPRRKRKPRPLRICSKIIDDKNRQEMTNFCRTLEKCDMMNMNFIGTLCCAIQSEVHHYDLQKNDLQLKFSISGIFCTSVSWNTLNARMCKNQSKPIGSRLVAMGLRFDR